MSAQVSKTSHPKLKYKWYCKHCHDSATGKLGGMMKGIKEPDLVYSETFVKAADAIKGASQHNFDHHCEALEAMFRI